MRSWGWLGWLRDVPCEAGQALAIFAGGAAVIVGLLALSVDVGQLVVTRTDLQKAADAAAFAAAQELPARPWSARTIAEQYARENAGSNVTVTVTFSQTYNPNDTVTVEVARPVRYAFLHLLGTSQATVRARATARIGYYSGGTGVMPWGFIASNDPTSTLLQNACFEGWNADGTPRFRHNTVCTIKYGAGTNSGGDFGALAIDGPGASEYRDDIEHGSSRPVKKGDQLDAQTGNMSGPTQQAVNWRLSQPPPPGCPGNERGQVLVDNPDGTVSIRPGCERSPRILIVPVVDRIQNPSKSTVIGFAFLYLRSDVPGSGTNSAVRVEFVQFVSELPNAEYNAASGDAWAIRLVE
jgi:hypothetical protein